MTSKASIAYDTPFAKYMRGRHGPNWQIMCANSKIAEMLRLFVYARAVGKADIAEELVLQKKTFRGRVFGTVKIDKFVAKLLREA